MVRPVKQGDLQVTHLVSGQNTGGHRFGDPLLYGLNKLSWDRTADDGIDELQTCPGVGGFDRDLHVAVLAPATGLPDVPSFGFRCFANRLFERNLRFTDVWRRR